MNEPAVSRRGFLRSAGIGAAGMAGAALIPSRLATCEGDENRAKPASWTQVSEHLSVYHGPINVGLLRDGRSGKALLIDCGDGRVSERFEKLGVTAVDRVVFTHHHRDQACGAWALKQRGAKIGVPARERDHFEKVAAYWCNPASRWHLYNFHPHHLMLGEPLGVDDAYEDGQSLDWGPARIRAIATPGHTDGSLSYLVEVDGRRVIFSGDTIYDRGQVWDLHSLQRGFARNKRQIGDYHGFLGAQWQLSESLGRIKQAGPEMLVPSHGHILRDPAGAIDALSARLAACYDKYVAISALRHYFPELFSEFAGRKDHMPIRPGKPVPACLRHFGTTWMLVSEDRAALAMDCGGPQVVQTIGKMLEKGEIRRVEGLWVTHYHDDHVDAIPQFQKAFDCPCITDRHVAEVITDPVAWRLPCISPSRARVDRPTRDGESWQWHEFKLTAYYYPGQTLYHGALLVEGGGLRMFFVGDSHTPAGIDDYCAQNRNWLGAGAGFDRCLALIEKLRPTHLFNCHVDDAFDFTPEQCRFMRENLAQRERLFGQLVPWDHANYALDDSWVRCHPYEQTAAPGARVDLGVVVTNHSAGPQQAACRGLLHPVTSGRPTEWRRAEIAAKSEQEVRLSLIVPRDTAPGRHVLSIDVCYGPWDLPQFTEAIVVVPG
jgi:glyoxylase-like metal-dependent hydrolase (beta-lactamase superfamily II)